MTKLKALSLSWKHFHFRESTFTFAKVKNPLHCPFSPPTPLSSSCWLFCPLGAQQNFSLQGPPDYPLTHLGGAAELTTYKTPCCRPEGRGTSILLHLVMRKIEMMAPPPCCCFGWVPPDAADRCAPRRLHISPAPPAQMLKERTSIICFVSNLLPIPTFLYHALKQHFPPYWCLSMSSECGKLGRMEYLWTLAWVNNIYIMVNIITYIQNGIPWNICGHLLESITYILWSIL